MFTERKHTVSREQHKGFKSEVFERQNSLNPKSKVAFQALAVGIARCAVTARVQRAERMEPRCSILPKVFRACTAR
jgi:hypothetical protein